MSNYALEGQKWGTGPFGTFGGVITWAVDNTVPADFVDELQLAFSAWSAIANISFTQVGSLAASSIDIGFGGIDGPNGALGLAQYSYSGSTFISAAVTFDSAEGWHASGGQVVTNSGANLVLIAAHEIGHAIGLDHYNGLPAIMNTVLSPSIVGLTQSDVDGARAIYGPAPAPPAPDAYVLVDDAFYYARYPDVQAAGVDPDDHYAQHGWHEGRDPNAYFSTTGYLAIRSDVAVAGVNPLQHFDAAGWREGFDPSASFDAQLYLERNPDVARAGVDPLEHFLQHGQLEGRPSYIAIGRPQDFAHGSFDAEFYLLNNLDVARAALQTGADGATFAYQHYTQYGWHEGRNPNSVFDTNAYLAAYQDVKAAGIDPLMHYDTWGWQQNRDPSAHFDTALYEASNPDVANAHVNPLLHYLGWGIHEARATYDDGHFGFG